MIETVQVGEHLVTFDSETHTYEVDGKPVISVTQLIKDVLPQTYRNVDPDILRRAALRGTELHDAIEQFEVAGEMSDLLEFKYYRKLKRQHQFEVKKSEQIVVVKHHGIILCAGRFDMIVESPFIQGKGIVDVKRTAHLFHDHLKLQLNLYKLGYEQTFKEPIHYLKCIHLRFHHHEYVDVSVDSKFVKHYLDLYMDKYHLYE